MLEQTMLEQTMSTGSFDYSPSAERSSHDRKIFNFSNSTDSHTNQNFISQPFKDVQHQQIEQLYKRLVEDMTNQFIQENKESSFDPIYFCDLEPDLLFNSVSILKSFAARIEDRSSEIEFEDDEI